MDALNLFHKLSGRQRRYRLRPKRMVSRSMDSILDRLDGSKRRVTYPNSEVNIALFFMPNGHIIVRVHLYQGKDVICSIPSHGIYNFMLVAILITLLRKPCWEYQFRSERNLERRRRCILFQV